MVNGTNFSTAPGGTAIYFLSAAATGVTCASSTQYTVVVPPNPSASQVVPVTATVNGLSSLDAASFSYGKPIIPPCKGTTCM
jgi:hypothetical protein